MPYRCLCDKASLHLLTGKLTKVCLKFVSMDAFGYFAADAGAMAGGDRIGPERDELRAVMVELRLRYGRRRLFRVAEVAEVVRSVRARRDGPETPERPEAATVRRHVRWTVNDM